MEIVNHTRLSTTRIEGMFDRATSPWTSDDLQVIVRYSRGAVYSGTFASNPPRIYVNVGGQNHYPLKIETSTARARTIGQSWWKPTYQIEVADAYQLAVFVFLHEFYHYLIHRAGRNSRRKEAMCDRFAVRYLADRCRVPVCDASGRSVPRTLWLFQDLDGFVASKATLVAPSRAGRRPRPAGRSRT